MKNIISNEQLNRLISNIQTRLKNEDVVNRIWNYDYTVWSDSPEEISNRLGWLNSIEASINSIGEIETFVKSVIDDGFKKVILMGMGGSSLAPEVFRLIFGVKDGFLNLQVADSTHPDFLSSVDSEIKFDQTLFLVSTKSGGTIETISFLKYFYNKTVKKLGKDIAGKHFAAITDPGSGLEKLANNLGFGKIFLNDPDIGGRYSALSLFGMVPAALVGVDISKLLLRTKSFAAECKNSKSNPAAELGVILGVSASFGIDKVTFISSQQINYIGAWIEQLIAESTGKDGKGILPIDLEELLPADYYSKDRIFIYIKLKDDESNKFKMNELAEAGFPIVTIGLDDIYDLGREYFRWEFATIVAGWIMGIQPFDQPNVESAKIVARKMMEEFKNSGHLAEIKANFVENGIKLSGNLKSINLKDALIEFLGNIVEDKSYVAIQAYVDPDGEANSLLQKLRTVIQKSYRVPTTVGYGPRFLHSTGQLHKGDAGDGLFIQIIGEPENDLPIPDVPGGDESSISFGILIRAQALGDREALIANDRKVLTIELGKNIQAGLQTLLNMADS